MKFQPIFFERNRVKRVYSGGMLFSEFFGDDPEDGFFPEEWIASSVKAINKEMLTEKDGISKIKGENCYFDELLAKYPCEMLGSSEKMRILVKILDSAVRLPAQAHPDKAFSRKYFNSEYGKTESWVILGTRPGAKIYFGFKDGVTKEDFVSAIDESEYDKDAMQRLMEYTEPKVGDVYLVPAKTVHAIGAGCLILEVQEPTDFTIQPEHWCDEYKLNEQEMYIGLSKEDAIDCFDFCKANEAKIAPALESRSDEIRMERLIQSKDTDCFIINRITLTDGEYKLNINDSYGVYIVTDGNGCIEGRNYSKEINKGDYFFIPAVLMGQYNIKGNLQIIECY